MRRRGVAQLDLEPLLRPPRHREHDGGARRVAARVGESFLHDPVGGSADGDLQVEVRSLAPVAVAAVSPLPGAGTGLIGLAERVAQAGGELEHGVDADGAFVVRARLPR